jgi:hypothetical protein
MRARAPMASARMPIVGFGDNRRIGTTSGCRASTSVMCSPEKDRDVLDLQRLGTSLLPAFAHVQE